MDERIPVGPAELARAIRVWLRVMPKPIWRALEKYQLAALEKRHDPDEEPQVHAALAEHIADHFGRADWRVSRPEPRDLGSPPPWKGGEQDERSAPVASPTSGGSASAADGNSVSDTDL
jgi:hypothetical protein